MKRSRGMNPEYAPVWDKLVSTRPVNILIVGPKSSGKTAIFKQLFPDKIKKKEVRGTNLHVRTASYENIDFADLPTDAAESLPTLWKHFTQHLGAFIFVIDARDKINLEKHRDSFQNFKKACNLLGE
jgi:Cdc6-like AAA superfamily ATPase